MLPRNHPDRIQIAFDDHRLVANAGLILPATLALRLGLPQLLRKHLDLGGAPGRANTGDKMMTLVASALAGGDCIDDADVLRAGGTARVLGFTAKAPSTLGTFLRSFRWGHVRQLDRVSRELLARVWKAGAGPGDAPFTIDLDSTICETYGLAKEGARHHGYTGARGYHPLLAVAAGTGDVLLARLREGRANTARGAAHFLRETVGRVRYCGARGQLTVRADSGFYTHAVVAVCRRMDVRFSIAIRQRARLRNLIEAIPEDAWTPIPYWMDGVRTAEGGEGVTGAMIRARIWVDGRLAGGLQALLGAPMAAYSGCGERDGGIGHGKRRSRTGLAQVCGDVGLAGGSVADGRRQAGSGMARSRARARLNCSSQGQRRGRCRVNRRAERVIRPAKAKTRRLRVLVVTIC